MESIGRRGPTSMEGGAVRLENQRSVEAEAVSTLEEEEVH